LGRGTFHAGAETRLVQKGLRRRDRHGVKGPRRKKGVTGNELPPFAEKKKYCKKKKPQTQGKTELLGVVDTA